MSLFKLCSGDILTKTLRDVFNATPIRVPETRILPLCIVARKKKEASFRGELRFLIEDFENFQPNIKIGTMADVSGKKSKSVNVDLGLKILDGFLSGFGIPSAGITAKFNNVKKVSFSFKDVERKYVDINEFGYQLVDKKLNLSNPAINIFLANEPYDMLLIDSVITSSDFSISVEEGNDVNLNASIDEIKNIISEAKVKVGVSSSSGLDLTFKGEESLAFAFSTVQLFIDIQSKKITSIDPTKQVKSLEKFPKFMNTIFLEEEGMIEWDEID